MAWFGWLWMKAAAGKKEQEQSLDMRGVDAEATVIDQRTSYGRRSGIYYHITYEFMAKLADGQSEKIAGEVSIDGSGQRRAQRTGILLFCPGDQGRECFARGRFALGEQSFEDGRVQPLLVCEEIAGRGPREPRMGGNLSEARSLEPMLGKQGFGRIKDRRARALCVPHGSLAGYSVHPPIVYLPNA